MMAKRGGRQVVAQANLCRHSGHGQQKSRIMHTIPMGRSERALSS